MPNAKVLSEKQAIVAELTEKIQKATAGVIVDYKGITVEEDTALRKECREGGVDYAVVKNTLLRFAFNNTGLNDLDDLLNGSTSLALADDPVAPARVMADYAKKAETMEGADFLCLHFESADPNGANRSVAECVADAKAVAEAARKSGVARI